LASNPLVSLVAARGSQARKRANWLPAPKGPFMMAMRLLAERRSRGRQVDRAEAEEGEVK
jgi:hypothetical protein